MKPTEPGDMLAVLDDAGLSVRYWLVTLLLVVGLIAELYDFFIAGFIVSAVAPDWHLTFGQSSAILVSVGLGAIAGSLALGRLADQFGRKAALVAGGLICSVAAGAISLVPDRGWVAFALLRFLVGFGYGGASVTQLAMIVEFTPTRFRTLLSSLLLAPVAAGMLVASLVFATFLPVLGWRGVALLGAAPGVISLVLWGVCPESVRWLVSKSRNEEARKILATFLDRPIDSIPAGQAVLTAAQTEMSLGEVFRDRRRFWLVVAIYFGFNITITGCYLYGPVIVAQALHMSPRDAARQFIYVSLVGAVGRVLFSVLPHRLGRIRAGQISCFGAALAMVGASVFHDSLIGGVPAFLIFLIGGALFWDGGVSAISPYAAEIFPVSMSARGMGLAQAASGFGKFVGPLVLALIAGSSNFITPQTTAASVGPGFLFLAAGSLLTAFALTFWGREPHGATLSLSDEQLPEKEY